MRKFKNEEIEKRAPVLGLCQQLQSLHEEKMKELAVDWRAEFNKGGVDQVERLFKRTCEVVASQMRALSELSEYIRAQEALLKSEEQQIDKHMRFSELVKAHFDFSDVMKGALKREELDLEKLMSLLGKLHNELIAQSDKLNSVKKMGAGKQAYAEIDIKKLVEPEANIIHAIQPIGHDWEAVAVGVERMMKDIDNVDDETFDKVREQTEHLLGIYHSQFANNDRAPQLGTELALNLYIQRTKEITRRDNKIPIALINIDLTACNNLDGTHVLGNMLIDTCYRELDSRFRRDFTLSEKKGTIEGKGVVTILGRTRFKIVGVPKQEIEKALKEIPKVVMDELMKNQGSRFIGTKDEQRFLDLNTRMLAGYVELPIGGDSVEFGWAVAGLRLTTNEFLMNLPVPVLEGLDRRLERERLLEDIKTLEKSIAVKIDTAIKTASAKAEFLEKKYYPEMEHKRLAELDQKRKKAGIPDVITPIFKERLREIEQEAFKNFPQVLVYAESIDPVWTGLNYVPEEEFEGIMIKRVSHQIGLDTYLSNQFFDFFESVRNKKKEGKMTEQDAKKLQELKEQFYLRVLQKRNIQKSYDLRFTTALREEAYDVEVPKLMLIEGPQIFTFFELDGFNAFNKIYKPDGQDTYYHRVLKKIFEVFDEVFNNGVEDEYKIPLRMTKQGDEIWVSYPLHSERGIIKESDHVDFLMRVRKSLVSRKQGEALEVKNYKTVDWIPLLIEDEKEMRLHIDNAFSNETKFFYVDNEEHNPNREQSKDNPEITPANRDSFCKGLFKVYSIVHSNSHMEFKQWKTLNPARQVTGDGLFGPENFKYSYMLFDETVKKTVDGASSRHLTGRVIRLGTTIGYAGFLQPVLCKTPHQLETLREKLNGAVEDIRKSKGRGGIHNLEKEGFKYEIAV